MLVLNGRQGRRTGDAVLRERASMLKLDVRETRTIAREEGESFMVLLPDTRIRRAVYHADTLQGGGHGGSGT